jgi:hypothetical protein
MERARLVLCSGEGDGAGGEGGEGDGGATCGEDHLSSGSGGHGGRSGCTCVAGRKLRKVPLRLVCVTLRKVPLRLPSLRKVPLRFCTPQKHNLPSGKKTKEGGGESPCPHVPPAEGVYGLTDPRPTPDPRVSRAHRPTDPGSAGLTDPRPYSQLKLQTQTHRP